MIRRWRRGLVLAAVGVAAVAGVLLTTQPWTGETPVQEAVAQPAEFGMCNVSVSNIPPGLKVSRLVLPAQVYKDEYDSPSGMAFFLQISVPLPEGAKRPGPPSSDAEFISSNVIIDAQTGEVISERYKTAADEAAFKPVLARLQVGPWRPTGVAWPRTDTPPTGEMIEFPKVITVAADYFKPTLKYREPEAGSGMLAGRMGFATLPDMLRAYTCESLVEISDRGEVLSWEVTSEEELMFQRFLNEVVAP